MLNRVILQGRLGADPQLRTTPGGTEVATFNIAVDRDFKNKQTGEKETDWVTIVAWRNTAKFLASYFQKGRMAIVDGRLQIRNYTDKDGNKRTVAEVVADNIYFGDTKQNDGGNAGYAASGYGDPSYAASAPGQFEELDVDDGDLPF